jgi:sugar phosphate isomerase/epimerase
MLSRRRFSALTVAAAGAVMTGSLETQAAPSVTPATRSGLEFGVQLFMVRDRLADLPATLRTIREIGYPSVETFPQVYDRPARVLKATIADCGLKATSGHFDYATLEEHVDYAAELGLQYMICAWIPKPLQDSLEGFHEAVGRFNKTAGEARKAGIEFGFHPHNYEFRKHEGGRGFELLMRELDPAIRIELDVYWAVEAGEKPLELMHTLRDRLELIHIKDRKPTDDISFAPDEHGPHYTEAGSGTIDWKAILREARRMGISQYYVDQDRYDVPVEESLRRNWKYLSQLSL